MSVLGSLRRWTSRADAHLQSRVSDENSSLKYIITETRCMCTRMEPKSEHRRRPVTGRRIIRRPTSTSFRNQHDADPQQTNEYATDAAMGRQSSPRWCSVFPVNDNSKVMRTPKTPSQPDPLTRISFPASQTPPKKKSAKLWPVQRKVDHC